MAIPGSEQNTTPVQQTVPRAEGNSKADPNSEAQRHEDEKGNPEGSKNGEEEEKLTPNRVPEDNQDGNRVPDDNQDGNEEEQEDEQEEETSADSEETQATDKEFVIIMEFQHKDRDVLKCPSDLEDFLEPICQKYTSLKEVKPNHPRSLIAFVFTTEEEARDLVTTTDNHTEVQIILVECRWAKEEILKNGVIRGIIPPKFEEERTRRIRNMKEKLAKRGTPVNEIMWMKRKFPNEDGTERELRETNSVRLEFANEIPARVIIGLSSYSVDSYIPEVTQCFKCQGFGHVAKHCSQRFSKCINCGRIGHKKAECNARNPRCANCAGPHKAWSRMCPFYLKEVEALKIRATSKTTIHAARNVAEESFPALKTKQNNLDLIAAKREEARISYANATKNQENQRTRTKSTSQPEEQTQRKTRRRISRHKKEPKKTAQTRTNQAKRNQST